MTWKILGGLTDQNPSYTHTATDRH